jgi:hypothetical protein
MMRIGTSPNANQTSDISEIGYCAREQFELYAQHQSCRCILHDGCASAVRLRTDKAAAAFDKAK